MQRRRYMRAKSGVDMRICKDHWAMMREAIDNKGMSTLIAKDGETALQNEVAQLEAGKNGDPEPHKAAPFDPLMSMHWHFANDALRCGGLYLLGQKPGGGDYCPICEFVANSPGFVAMEAIDNVASQMQLHCYDEGLIPRPS